MKLFCVRGELQQLAHCSREGDDETSFCVTMSEGTTYLWLTEIPAPDGAQEVT